MNSSDMETFLRPVMAAQNWGEVTIVLKRVSSQAPCIGIFLIEGEDAFHFSPDDDSDFKNRLAHWIHEHEA